MVVGSAASAERITAENAESAEQKRIIFFMASDMKFSRRKQERDSAQVRSYSTLNLRRGSRFPEKPLPGGTAGEAYGLNQGLIFHSPKLAPFCTYRPPCWFPCPSMNHM